MKSAQPPHRSSLHATLAEVADLAGVSTATVSRTINNPAQVSPKTAAKVQAAITATGYVPNLTAGGLASQRSRLVAAIIPAMEHSIFSSTVQAMTNALFEHNYQVLLGLSGNHDQLLPNILDSALGRRPDGLILTGSIGSPEMRQRLRQTGIPIIETWDLPERPIDMTVGFSHHAVGCALAQFVIAKGYQRPMLISASGLRSLRRRHGFCQTMVEHGRTEPPHIACELPTTVAQARRDFSAFLDSGGTADVVVCSSDWSALGVMVEAQSRGLVVPRDVAVIGFADLDFAADIAPALTTVRIDGQRIGRQAAEFLLRRARGEAIAMPCVDVGFEIIDRNSA